MIAALEEIQVQKTACVELRRATLEDCDALVAMYRSFEPKAAASGLPPREPERWLDGLAAYPNFIALVEDRVVGHAVLCPEDSSGEIAVFIHQDYRSQGLGKKLLREVVREARRLGLRRVRGTTELQNVPMLRLAHSLGFTAGDGPGEFYLDLREPNAMEQERLSLH